MMLFLPFDVANHEFEIFGSEREHTVALLLAECRFQIGEVDIHLTT